MVGRNCWFSWALVGVQKGTYKPMVAWVHMVVCLLKWQTLLRKKVPIALLFALLFVKNLALRRFFQNLAAMLAVMYIV